MNVEATMYSPVTGNFTGGIQRGATLVYKGGTLTLDIVSGETLPASNQESSVEINIGNPVAETLYNDNWLYIDGAIDYASLRLIPSDGGAELKPAPGNYGSDYCWIKLPNINGGSSFKYNMAFTYNGSGDGGKINIYTSSSFEESVSWTPNTSAKLDPADVNNRPYLGDSKTLTLVKPEPRLTGNLSVSSLALAKDNEYTLTATLSGASSNAVIKNPEMVITIPKGHKYIPGSAEVVWNGVTQSGTSFESALNAATTNTADPQPFTFKAKEVLSSGDLLLQPSSGETNQQKVILTAKYKVDCESDLYNVYFSGTINGTTVYDDTNVLNNDAVYYSESMRASISASQDFKVAPLVFSTNILAAPKGTVTPATTNMTVSFNRTTTLTPLGGSELLRIILPEELDLNGNITLDTSSEIAGINIGTPDNRLDNGKRIISITLDYATMNAASNKEGKVAYNIPLKSSFTGATGEALLNAPSQEVLVSVTRNMDLPGCISNPKPFPVSEEVKKNLLFFAYDTGNGKVSAGKSYLIENLSNGVTGNMTVDNGSSNSINEGKWTYSPAMTEAPGTKTVLITPVHDGNTFDPVTFTVEVYPRLDFSLNTISSFCGEQIGYAFDTNTLLVTPTAPASPYSLTYSFYKSNDTNTNGSLKDENKVTSANISSTNNIFYAQSFNGYEYGEPEQIVFTVNTPVTLDAITTPINIEGTTGTLTVNVTAGTKDAAGKYTYTLHKDNTVDGSPVVTDAASNAFTLTVTPPTTTAYNSYTYYATVQGATSCGATSTNNVIVNVYPIPVIGLTTSNVAFCSDDLTLTGGISLDNYLLGADPTLYNYTYSKDGEAFAPLTGSINLATAVGTHTYVLRATNKLTSSILYADATLTITVDAPVVLNAITTPINLEGAGNAVINVVKQSGTPASGNFTYKLYDKQTDLQVGSDQINGSFSVPLSAPAATSVFDTYTYYATVQGATSCNPAISNDVTVNVYPLPVLNLTGLPLFYCETDATLLAGIDLWEYVDSPNETWFTYTYSTDGGSTWAALTAGTAEIPVAVGEYNYQLKAVNKLSGSSEEKVQTFTVKVERKTVISLVDGNEVTEGDAVNIIVSAVGEEPLSYIWQKWDGSSWQTITGVSGNTYNLSTSVNINENGDRYRVTVNGSGSVSGCNSETKEFTLKVKPAITPPLGNNKVSWEVIGYGNVSVTADGISISNGNHVNNGTKLLITGTTWKSNILKSITINGTEYTNSSVSYTVNGASVHIVVEFLGSDPNPDPDSNAEIESGTRIWTEGGYAHIYTETAGRARIVTFNGRLVTDQKLSEGESRIQLPDGYYIVTLSDGTTKKIAVRNS